MAYWNGLASSLLAPVEFDPFDRERFTASLSFDSLGCVDLFETHATPTSIVHTAAHAAHTVDRRFYVLMPVNGTLQFGVGGRRLTLEPGDFTLFDGGAPFRIAFGEPNRSLSLAVPPETAQRHLPDAERLCVVQMRAECGLNATVSSMLTSLWTLVERGAPAEPRPAIARSLLEMLAASYVLELGGSCDESATRRARRSQVMRHIEAHLQDPVLGPESIARALRLSTRYLRQLFAGEPETIPGHILRRRLEECAQRLTHPLWRRRSVTEIAFHWGFVSAAHFARVFKARYGVTPTKFRQASGAPAVGAG